MNARNASAVVILGVLLGAMPACAKTGARSEISNDATPPRATASASASATASATAEAASPSKDGFDEGEIELTVDSDIGKGGSVTSKFKGKRMRSVVRWGETILVTFVSDEKKRTLTALSLSSKAYREVELDKEVRPGNPNVRPTGRIESVLGYRCEVIEVTDTTPIRRELCVSKEFPALHVDVGPARDGTGFEPRFAHGFPLRISLFGADAQPAAKMEATRIEKHPVLDTTFDVPADYRKVR